MQDPLPNYSKTEYPSPLARERQSVGGMLESFVAKSAMLFT